MLFPCPECGGELSQHGALWSCQECCSDFHRTVHCEKCDSVLEPIKACGAVDYFCEQCGELKSKRTLVYRFEKVDK